MKIIRDKGLSDNSKRNLKGNKKTKKLIMIRKTIRKAKYYDNQFKDKAILMSYFERAS